MILVTRLLAVQLLLLSVLWAHAKVEPFYPAGSVVRELDVATIENILMTKSDKKYLIVYFAPWCGHCQRFAPLFIKAATTYADVDVSFMALDCVKHRDVCTEQKIKSYPTIRGYGFGDDVEKELAKKDIHTITEVETFILKCKNNFRAPKLRGDAKNPPIEKENVVTKERVIAPLVFDRNYKPADHQLSPNDARWINKTIQSTARVSSAQDRLHDALVSLRFLLQMEVLTLLNNPADKEEVMEFLKFVINLLPEQHQDPFLRFYVYLQQSADTINSAEIDIAATDAFGDAYSNWNVCGVSVSTRETGSGPNGATNARVISKKKEGLFSRAHEGYLCGLWMLFHFLTVAAEERFILSITEVLSSSTVNTLTITALDVMSHIHLCVDKFFNCRHCRLHFLDNYSQCIFGRCDIKKSEFDKLQKWLWEFHNYVTQSILHYHLSPENIQDGTEMYYKHVVNWPDRQICVSCYETKDVSKHSTAPANKYIKAAYWDPAWKLRTVHEYKPEHAHAMQNPFASSSSSTSSHSVGKLKTLSSPSHQHPVISTSVSSISSFSSSSSSSSAGKNQSHPQDSNEDTLITLGVVSLVSIFFLTLMVFFVSCRNKKSHYSSAAFRRGRYS